MHLTIKLHRAVSPIKIFYCGIFLAVNCLCFFQYRELQVPSLFVAVLLLAIGCVIPYEELSVYLFICLAFFNVMNAHITKTSLYYLLCGIVILRYLIQGKKKYRLAQKLLLLCVVFIITAYNLTDIRMYLSWFVLLLTCIMLYGESIVTSRITKIIDLYSIALIMASWWGWLMVNSGMNINTGAQMYLAGHYSYLRFGGLVGDSVWFSGQLLVIIAAHLALLLHSEEKKGLRIICVVLAFVLGALTYAKTFYLGFFIEVFLALWYCLKSSRKKAVPYFLIIVSFLLLAIAFVFLGKSTGIPLITNMLQRLQAKDLSTGRLTAWIYYIDLWLNDWTFLFKGMGFSQYATRRTFAGYSHSIMYAHNILIETVTVFGLIETLFLITVIIYAIVRYLREKSDVYWLLPTVSLFIIGMVSHGHFEYSYYFNVLLVISIPKAYEKTKYMDDMLAEDL